MENKHVGWLVIGISVIMIGIIFLFSSALQKIVTNSCSMEKEVCPMYQTINQQTYLALSIVGLLIILGIVLIFSKPKEKIVTRTIRERKKPLDLSGLDGKEKSVVKMIQDENGVIFQSALTEKLGIGKVGLTRLLDKLEAKQIIERKRRGMNNVVVLRN